MFFSKVRIKWNSFTTQEASGLIYQMWQPKPENFKDLTHSVLVWFTFCTSFSSNSKNQISWVFLFSLVFWFLSTWPVQGNWSEFSPHDPKKTESKIESFLWEVSSFHLSKVGEWSKKALGGLGTTIAGGRAVPQNPGHPRTSFAWSQPCWEGKQHSQQCSFPVPLFPTPSFYWKREYLFSHRCWMQKLCILVLSVCFQLQKVMDV